MLHTLTVHPNIPAKDLNRARKFYADTLGFGKPEETAAGLRFNSGDSWFFVYVTMSAGTAGHTLMGWETDNLERDVAALRKRGVTFEEYDYPTLKTVNGIADAGGNKAAWFKDSEGNILGIVEIGAGH